MSDAHHVLPTIDLAEFARMEEARQATGVAQIADEAEAIAGGMMCFGGVGSWANQAMGLGMEGPVEREQVDRLIQFYESRGVEPKIELCPYAHESLVRALADARFVLREFETVLVRDLRAEAAPLPPVPQEIEIVVVDPADEARVEMYQSITRAGFAPHDAALFARLERRMMTAPAVRCFMGLAEGQTACAGAAELTPPCAGLFGLATLEPFRRRGCQRALMIARLRAARDAGCRYASVHSRPDVATGRNAMRLGFLVAFTKAILARPGPRLVPSP